MKTNPIFKKIMIALSVLSLLMLSAATVLLPELAGRYENLTNQAVGHRVIIFLILTCVPLFAMLICFLKLSLSLYKNAIFEDKTIKRIKVVQCCALVEVGLYIYAVFVRPSLLSAAVLAGTIIVSLFTSIIREILAEGKEYYEDSRLSI